MDIKELRKVYCVLLRWPSHSDSANSVQDFFIGHTHDGSYHVLGCRPPHLAYFLKITGFIYFFRFNKL